MAKGRFGGDTYKPSQLGPEPAAPDRAPITPPEPSRAVKPEPVPTGPSVARVGVRTRVLSHKVPFSSRVSPAAQESLARLVERTGRPMTHLLEEALTDLFDKYKKQLS